MSRSIASWPRAVPSLVGLWITFMCYDVRADTIGCENLLLRLPECFERYKHILEEEGRGDEFRRSSEEWLHLILIESDGPSLRDSTWKEVHRDIRIPGSDLIYSYSPDQSVWAEWLEDSSQKNKFDAECRELLAVQFQLPDDLVLFTIGHATEGCTDVPWMIWDHGGQQFRYPLPDFLGYNIEGLWCTGHYLIFHLRVEYEFGGQFEGLGFWNLETARISMATETRVGSPFDDEIPRKDPTEGLGHYLRELHGAGIKQDGAVILVRRGNLELAFWPEAKEWALLSGKAVR